MSTKVKAGRPYDSSRRREQARQNRWAVLMAGQRLFIEKGYAGTTVAEIAAEAGLSVESVYKMFTNKVGLLKVVFDVTVAGDDEPVPMVERPDIQAIITEPDPARKIEMNSHHLTTTMPRTAPLQIIMRDAAGLDPAVAELWQSTIDQYLFGMSLFAENLLATGKLKPGLKKSYVRDVLWSFNSVEFFDLIVRQRGWSLRRYETLLAESLKGVLLP